MGHTEKAALREELRDLGLRATAPRIAVLLLLRSADRPLSHGEVVDRLGTDDWDRATIFRNLGKLVEMDLARVASHLGGITRYEAVSNDGKDHLHAHFSCRLCGFVSCLPDTALPLPRDPEWQAAVEGAEVQVVGTCPSCRKSAAAN